VIGMALSDREAFRERIYQHYASQHRGVTDAAHAHAEARSPFLDHVIRRYFPAPRDSVVVDLGCGAGALLSAAKRAGYANLRGFERSPEEVTLAHALGLSEVACGDADEGLQALAAESIDLVCSIDLIEHMDRFEALRLADGVQRVLRPTGTWLIHTVNGDSPWFGRVRYGDITHEQVYTPSSLAQLLRAAGFGSVTCEEDGPVAHGVVSGVRRVLWRGTRQVLRFALAVETGSWSRETVLTQNLIALARRS
jgi:SAM-dependent methyltransferase